jgi:predicted nucleic acid-binding protein/transposase-like protein
MVSDMVKITFTIDAETAVSLEKLAKDWDVPKSEAFRRAVRQAREQHLLQVKAGKPIDVLEQLEHHPILSDAERKSRLATARRLRKTWNLKGRN